MLSLHRRITLLLITPTSTKWISATSKWLLSSHLAVSKPGTTDFTCSIVDLVVTLDLWLTYLYGSYNSCTMHHLLIWRFHVKSEVNYCWLHTNYCWQLLLQTLQIWINTCSFNQRTILSVTSLCSLSDLQTQSLVLPPVFLGWILSLAGPFLGFLCTAAWTIVPCPTHSDVRFADLTNLGGRF